MKQESRGGFTSCSLADSHIPFHDKNLVDLRIPRQAYSPRKGTADELGFLPWPRAERRKSGWEPILAKPQSHLHHSIWCRGTARQRQWLNLHVCTTLTYLQVVIQILPCIVHKHWGQMKAGAACAVCATTQELSFPTAGTIPVPLAATKDSLVQAIQLLSGLLQTSSHLFHLWVLSISEKDAEVAAHTRLTSIVTLSTNVTVSPGSEVLRTLKSHGHSQTLRRYLTYLICFTQSRKQI